MLGILYYKNRTIDGDSKAGEEELVLVSTPELGGQGLVPDLGQGPEAEQGPGPAAEQVPGPEAELGPGPAAELGPGPAAELGAGLSAEPGNGRRSTGSKPELDVPPTPPQSSGHRDSRITEVSIVEPFGTGRMQGKISDADNIPAVEVDRNGGGPGSV